MEPKRFLAPRDVSFSGLSRRIAAIFPHALRPGAPLGNTMGSVYGANFELSVAVNERTGRAARQAQERLLLFTG